MKFLSSMVQKLSSEQTHRQTDGQTDRQTDSTEIITYPHTRMVISIKLFMDQGTTHWSQSRETRTNIKVAHPRFPRGDANHRGRGRNLLFDKIFAKNCMKMNEIGLDSDHKSYSYEQMYFYIFTVCNEVAKVMFSEACVKNSVHKGRGCLSTHPRGSWWGICPGGVLSRPSPRGEV